MCFYVVGDRIFAPITPKVNKSIFTIMPLPGSEEKQMKTKQNKK